MPDGFKATDNLYFLTGSQQLPPFQFPNPFRFWSDNNI